MREPGLPGVESDDAARLLPALHDRAAGPDADGALVVHVLTLPLTFSCGGERERLLTYCGCFVFK